jgi:hypothetical protein
MNAQIRQHGILLKSVAITSDRVRIGSGDVCEIQLSDPFLAPVVAELVRRGQEWRMVDAGVSLAGVTRGGTRVMDERLAAGESYVVGAFELMIEPDPATGASHEMSRVADGSIPLTMMEVGLGVLPPTMVRQTPVASADVRARASSDSKLVFTPIEEPRQALPARCGEGHRSAPVSTRSRLLLVGAVVLASICVGLAVVVGTGESKKPKPAAGSETTSKKPAPPAVRGRSGDELAANLEIDQAFAVWEAEFAAKPTAELRNKIVAGSLELARAYGAAHDAQTASRYFKKIVRYGDPNSDAVRFARSRLAPQN